MMVKPCPSRKWRSYERGIEDCSEFKGTDSQNSQESFRRGLTKRNVVSIKEMLYGIQASKDVKLSNISRTFKEDQPLIKTEDRLSRNLDDEDFTDPINGEICQARGFQGDG